MKAGEILAAVNLKLGGREMGWTVEFGRCNGLKKQVGWMQGGVTGGRDNKDKDRYKYKYKDKD